MTKSIKPDILEKAEKWLSPVYDQQTREAVRKMIAENPEELADSFYKDLEFGTGGLRGLMGAGTNRMNVYTVGAATQGLSNYLNKCFAGQEIKVAIAHDSRNNSRLFAQTCADVFSANGIKTYFFDELRPTPELSFAVRHLACQSGVMLTASHNPKEYNGYKAYWADGSQVVPPHDKNIITEVNAVQKVEDILFKGNPALIVPIGAEMDDFFLEEACKQSLGRTAEAKNLKIVYSALHGTGITMVPKILQKLGFENLHIVEAQAISDGNFPTVIYPNPEEPEAMAMAVAQAEKINADLVLATDPDADRVGIAVPNLKGEMQLLNGNQTAALLFQYILERRKALGLYQSKDYVAKTIVTTELLDDLAENFGLHCFTTLTGFKYIGSVMRENEGKLNYVLGAEESYGYLAGDFVRDKDAITAAALICEMAAYAKSLGLTVFEYLIEIYKKHSFYKESLLSVTKKGMSGAEEIKELMKTFRENPPKTIDGSPLVALKDYAALKERRFDGKPDSDMPADLKTDALQFYTADGVKISVRPSGTEPKIKYYFSLKTQLESKEAFEKTEKLLDDKIERVIADLKLR